MNIDIKFDSARVGGSELKFLSLSTKVGKDEFSQTISRMDHPEAYDALDKILKEFEVQVARAAITQASKAA